MARQVVGLQGHKKEKRDEEESGGRDSKILCFTICRGCGQSKMQVDASRCHHELKGMETKSSGNTVWFGDSLKPSCLVQEYQLVLEHMAFLLVAPGKVPVVRQS